MDFVYQSITFYMYKVNKLCKIKLQVVFNAMRENYLYNTKAIIK